MLAKLTPKTRGVQNPETWLDLMPHLLISYCILFFFFVIIFFLQEFTCTHVFHSSSSVCVCVCVCVSVVQTYSVNFQISDSAATAYLGGVKTNLNTLTGNKVTFIPKWAKDSGKSVCIITTTQVQHGSPATTCAHRASGKWYSDADMPDAAKQDSYADITSQLLTNTDIDFQHSDLSDVTTGGGRKYMTPKGTKDPEYPTDLFLWGQKKRCVFLNTKLWLFFIWFIYLSLHDLRFEVERDPWMDPPIAETTQKAILEGENKCIDQVRHAGHAYMALHEMVASDYTIAKDLELTKEHKTLTIVMADHSHPVTFNGYPGQSILGKCPLWASDMLPYTTLTYGKFMHAACLSSVRSLTFWFCCPTFR
uniref:alkaline phosphatase n=1 Tax=Monopterus albus TaxID=43700 RepID=A0A3Q3KD21_MONAL